MINVFIKGQTITIPQVKVVSDSVNYLEAQFFFQTADWSSLHKWAHFKDGDNVYDFEIIDDKITADRSLNLYAGNWKVYVHGERLNGEEIEKRITTDEAPLTVIQSGMLDGSPLPPLPPSATEQIAEDAAKARELAQSVRDDADSGVFTPKRGVDYWTEEDQNAIISDVLSHFINAEEVAM